MAFLNHIFISISIEINIISPSPYNFMHQKNMYWYPINSNFNNQNIFVIFYKKNNIKRSILFTNIGSIANLHGSNLIFPTHWLTQIACIK